MQEERHYPTEARMDEDIPFFVSRAREKMPRDRVRPCSSCRNRTKERNNQSTAAYLGD